MKKIIIVLLFICLIGGCTNKISDEELIYDKYLRELKQIDHYDEKLDFDINITIDKLNEEELVYRVYIDNPKVDMNEIEALVIHDKKTDDVYPSSGIFEEPLSLKVNREEDDPKGIILGGYIDYKESIDRFNGIFKVMIKYKSKTVYYMQQFMTK